MNLATELRRITRSGARPDRRRRGPGGPRLSGLRRTRRPRPATTPLARLRGIVNGFRRTLR